MMLAKRPNRRLVITGGTEQLEPLREWFSKTIAAHSPKPVTLDAIGDIQLAVQEVITNIMFHGLQPGSSEQIAVGIEFEGLSIHLTISYNGVPFSYESPLCPSFDGSRDHGFGLFLITQLMDEVSYTFSNGRNTVRLRKEPKALTGVAPS